MSFGNGKKHFVPVSGDITEANLGEFRIALNRATNASSEDVHLDLSRAENLSGLALGLIAHAHQQLAEDGRKMHIQLGDNRELLQPVSHLLV